jgi:predicted ArsR family transcriptional regulator
MDPLEASRLVTDEYSAKILVATFRKPRSAIDLSREYGIPIAACYRRIHALEKAGLVRCTERALTQKGKRISLYISQLRNAYIFFENGKLRVRFQLATGVMQDFGGDWKAVEVTEPTHQDYL